MYNPEVEIVPPVAVNVGTIVEVVPLLIIPTTVNDCATPGATVIVDGVIDIAVNTGGGRVIVTTLVSENPFDEAITLKVPAVAPAVYSPEAEIVPPVAVNVGVTNCVLPLFNLPITENCCVAADCSDILSGFKLIPTKTG